MLSKFRNVREISTIRDLCIHFRKSADAFARSIPENLRQILRDVISQRKEASAFYNSKPDRKGDAGGHAHYLKVLEEACKHNYPFISKPDGSMMVGTRGAESFICFGFWMPSGSICFWEQSGLRKVPLK